MKRLFYTVFIPCMIGILTVAIVMPQNNLIPYKMLIYTIICSVLLLGLKCVLSGCRFLDKIAPAGMKIYVLCYGIALFTVSLLLRSLPVTDYGYVYQTAQSLADGEVVSDWTYFSMWTNNLGNLSVLTLLMKIGNCLFPADAYYFVLLINVLQMMAAMVAIYYLAGKMGLKNRANQWFAMILFSMWTPIWASTNGFYSDQLSFGGSVIAIAVLVYSITDGCLKKYKKWVVLILGGLLWGISANVKVTSAIAMVALVIGIALSLRFSKKYWKELAVLGLAFAIAFVGLYTFNQTYPSKADEYRLKSPTEYWIAMGLVGNGSYSDNTYLIKKCNYSQNIDERREVCREIIRENLSNLYDLDHVTKKASVIFGAGDILPTSVQYPEKQSFLWECIYWEGAHYWRYTSVCTGFFYAVLFLILMGTLLQAVKPKEDGIAFLAYLTTFGLFLFLMLWEAQNKQLYNHIPWMTLAAVYGVGRLEELMKAVGKKLIRK